MKKDIHLVGLDLGSISVNAIVINKEGKIVYEEDYRRHSGKPLEVAREMAKKIAGKYPFQYMALTGSNGEYLSKEWNLLYLEEIIVQAKGIHHLHPEIRTVIDIGGCDAKFIQINEKGEVEDFGMNSSCASGTGSFLDQQARRLELDIEKEFAQEALKSANPARLAARCAVFAKTDMIHLQQKATPTSDITMGLCEALARSYKSNIARGKDLKGPISFQGGVAANEAMLVAFKRVLKREDITVPKHFYSMGALGAALVLLEKKEVEPFDESNLEREISLIEEREALPKLSLNYKKEETTPLEEDCQLLRNGQLIDAYLGIDIGSVSTNVVVTDKKKHLLVKSYLPTAGKPIKAVQDGLREVKRKIEGKVRIKGVGVTGSGRYMIGAFVGADVIRNEITAQARGALNVDPEVDTIFEIGGQDSKFISLEKGTIIDFTMNKACAAGTGSFLEEQAEELGINIKNEFEQIALSSDSPADLGDRCTVFMESALFEHLQRGFPIPNLVGGLAYSVAHNYLNKVVENRKIGDNIFFQGGTACNKSVLAALENILGKRITVPPHNEVLGAIGAAIVAGEETKGKSKFKGFALSEANYRIESFVCQDGVNHCKVNQVWIEGEEKPLTYGDRCDKYSGKEGRKQTKGIPNLFKERHKLLFAREKKLLRSAGDGSKRKKIGIARSLHAYELFPLWEGFFTELGYKVILSDRTNDSIIHQGIEIVVADTCFPIKVTHGHVLNLLGKNLDYIFMPSIIDFEKGDSPLKKTYNCPWSQSIPYLINATIKRENYSAEFLQPKISFRESTNEALKKIGKLLNESPSKIRKAIQVARKRQYQFSEELKKKGQEVLNKLGKKKGFVIVSRPYNGCDPGLNLDIVEKMRELGMLAIPMDFLDLDPSLISQDYPNMYWAHGQKILAAARVIKEIDNLYPIYITNFGCGPDSFISKYFAEEIGRPFLELQIDEHSAEAGIITRLEAFLDSIQNRKITQKKISKGFSSPVLEDDERTIYIPYMDDHSYALKAALQALGKKAEVMPISDLESQREGQKYTTGRECYPCILTTGDIIKVINKNGHRINKIAFFMGTAQGPCRFGQYQKFQQQILKRLGYSDIPIISLDSENSYGGYGAKFTKLVWEGISAIDILRKAQRLIRVDEIEKGETNRIYLKYRNEVCKLISQGKGLKNLMQEAAQALRNVKRKDSDKPVVTVVGEIYVRHNPYSNIFIIDELERLGVKVELASMREWFMYTNQMHKKLTWKEKDLPKLITNRIRNLFQEMIEKRLEKPFKDIIKGFEEPHIEEVLQLGEKYLDRSLRGEAILTVGKTIHSIERGRDGVVNVMPFTCMPGNIAWALSTQIEREYANFPILNLSYDGSHQANYLNKIRTFVFQVETRHKRKAVQNRR